MAPLQTQAVEQLRFVGTQRLCQIGHGGVGAFGRGIGQLQQRHAVQTLGQRVEHRLRGLAQLAQGIDLLHHGSTVACCQGLQQLHAPGFIHQAKHVAHRGLGEFTVAVGNGLVG